MATKSKELVANWPLKNKFNLEACIYEMSQMNHQWFRQIYLYCFYILELIRHKNDAVANPGPGIVYPTKAITAPYSEGNVEVFGTANAGTQCLAMSLWALDYNFRNPITYSADLVQIINNENNVYAAL